MNLNSTTSRIFAIVSLALIFISTNFLFSQLKNGLFIQVGNLFDCLTEENEYLWVGTDGGGLAKLNKQLAILLFMINGILNLPSNHVLAIAIDGQGNKWIGTWWGGGLAKFDGTSIGLFITLQIPDLPNELMFVQ
jgi:ligand-binding sensor domain-containing protein